jgi:hypothetical protein
MNISKIFLSNPLPRRMEIIRISLRFGSDRCPSVCCVRATPGALIFLSDCWRPDTVRCVLHPLRSTKHCMTITACTFTDGTHRIRPVMEIGESFVDTSSSSRSCKTASAGTQSAIAR